MEKTTLNIGDVDGEGADPQTYETGYIFSYVLGTIYSTFCNNKSDKFCLRGSPGASHYNGNC